MSYPPPQQPGGYPPAQEGYPPTQPGYPPAQGGYPPPQGGYPSAQGGYPPAQGGYPPTQQPAGAYAPGQAPAAYPPQQQPAGAYPPPQSGDDDDDDGPNENDSLPSAPNEGDIYVPQDATGLKTFDGYGDVGFKAGGYLPPPPPPPVDPGPMPEMTFGTGANITAEEAREALLQYVSEHCCYGKGAAEQMSMTDIKPSNAFHIILETFCEGRSTARVEVPFFGGTVDGPYNGAPPLPWDIMCSPSTQFSDQIVKLAVPHTEEVRCCGLCCGRRFVRCNSCHGRGRIRCGHCSGRGHHIRHRDGHSHHETCHFCHGRGRRQCHRCGGDGRVTCPHCKGSGEVKSYVELTVVYKNYQTDYILEQTDMPDELIRNVHGVQVFQQVLPQVWPIVGFPVPQVNENSHRLVEQAKAAHPAERQLNQRQTLRAVPVSEVDYKFKDSTSRFWVYGMDRKVYCPDYPQQCCWGCNIL